MMRNFLPVDSNSSGLRWSDPVLPQGFPLVRPRYNTPSEGGHVNLSPKGLDTLRVQTSCGYAVPRMDNARHRDTLVRWTEKKGPGGIADYQQQNNVLSIDGLPAPVARLGERR